MTKPVKINPEALGIIKCKNGYMVTKGKTMYETPYDELMIFETFDKMMKHIKGHFQ